jgi:hypothetical protein
MKKASRKRNDDLRPEYNFASMKGGVRGKYAERLRQGPAIAQPQREAAEAFPTKSPSATCGEKITGKKSR